ncbi:MAG: adenylate/guanylate cyclase domain-containing protein [Hyphomicrobiales bacterium]|nr:MAG: adenylate/guanylate cyclase domain-containing protein [Hyphomicrobiales bacterium]
MRPFLPTPTTLLAFAAAALIAFLAVGLKVTQPEVVRGIANDVFDGYQRLSPRQWSPDAPVRIVDIDEESLSRLGQWPWPRTQVAELVERLTAAGAAAIAFDFVFSEPDRSSPEEILATLPDSPARRALDAVLDPEDTNDKRLAQTLGSAPAVLAVVLANSGSTTAPRQTAGFAIAGDDPAPFVPNFGHAVVPLAILGDAARGLGAVNWIPDRDQVVRRVPLVLRQGDHYVPTLVAETLRVAQGASTYVLRASNASGETAFGAASGMNAIRIGAIDVPTDRSGAIVVHYGAFRSERFLPAWKLLEGKVPASEIAGRIILIGTSAAGLLDLRATPLNAAAAGVEVHAQAIEHILAGSRLVRPDWADGLETVAAVLGALLAAILVAAAPVRFALPLALLGVATFGAASWLAFSRSGVLVDPAFPIGTTLAALFAGTGIVTFSEQRARRRIRTAFSRYLAPDLVDELADDPARLVLGGEIRPLTVLFCDIRGFTTLAEGLDAEALTAIINGFLTPMTDVILSNRGTIDKYMGDAVMAFWNAPMDDADHAVHACRAALVMRDELAALNTRRAGDPITVGIGLNSGPCCVGNLGSEQRFDYSAIGDTVNIASRLEDLTKTYGVTTIAGDDTVAEAPGFAWLELDRIRAKGKTEAVTLYALAGDEEMRESAGFAALAESQSAFLAAYRAQDWAHARTALGEIAGNELLPLAGYAAFMGTRIDALEATPPPGDWGGIATFTTKE